MNPKCSVLVLSLFLSACGGVVVACDGAGGGAGSGGAGSSGAGGSVTCRPDCDPASCPAVEHNCVICDPQVYLVGLECAPHDTACGGVRWVCGHGVVSPVPPDGAITCRADCDTASCPNGAPGDGDGRCVVCDPQVELVDAGCETYDGACGGVRWACGP